MYADIYTVVEKRLINFLGEQAFTTDFAKRAIDQPVGGRQEWDNGDLFGVDPVCLRQSIPSLLSLCHCERRSAGTEAKQGLCRLQGDKS
ncbi:hypothetical protein GCM10007989_18860 [Devosia pacifica]|uniref:Uncharacterized protein n=1 Tax=Devosia pacifica TaxID=1335967 RepID=A0A918S4H8_9HYPH|nr:hypothetical protein GCM10007989_18860 [Devosia pacifica]